MKDFANPDLVLVNPGERHRMYQALGTDLSAIEPPVWAGLLAAFAQKQGFSVEVIDANAEELTPEEVADRVASLAPTLTAVVVYGQNPSASTQVMPAVSAVCTALKDHIPDLKVILVGGHVAALPELTLQQEAADFVAGGEGFRTLTELVQALKSPQPRLSAVHDLWYWEGPAITTTSSAPLIQDVDRDIGVMPWDLLPMDRYRAHNWHCFGGADRQPYASLYTSLGCPYHCDFCCIHAPFKSGEKALGYKAAVNSYRTWSPQGVIAQIDVLVNEFGVRNIKFADEIFVLSPKRVSDVCDLIIERGYELNIWAYARVDTIRDDRLLDKMKRAGINWLAFGIEAGSERVRHASDKSIREDRIFDVVTRTKAAGINVLGNYIFGLPEDDAATMQATLDLALALNAEWANFYCAMAYPGSKLYETALANGWPLPESWSGYAQHSVDTFPLPTKYLTGPEVLEFRDTAFQIYFQSPDYLGLVAEKFGLETVRHIREMCSNTLDRKFLPERKSFRNRL